MRFSGIVKTGHGRGKAMGFPTANIEAPIGLPDGLYVGLVNHKPALIFVGAAKTFEESDRKAEAYILDFSGNLYGQSLEVETIKKIRDNMKFPSRSKLIEQMKQDERIARDFFMNYNNQTN